MEPTEILERLIAIPSVTGSEAALAVYCETFLQTLGFDCIRQQLADGRWNVLATRGEAPALLLYAHLDTVAPDPAWEQDPYQMQVFGDQLRGLGASDMKGGLAVMLAAAANSRAPLRIALGVDEEAWSAGAWTLANSGWCQGLKLVLVPELSIDSPCEVLGIGRRGHAAFVLRTYGPRQHGAIALSQPAAIEQACRMVLALRQNIGPDEGLVIRSIEASSSDLTVPADCEVAISWLMRPGRSAAALLSELQALALTYAGEAKAAVRPTPVPEAYAIAEGDAAVIWVQNMARSTLGREIETAFGLSVADENVLATLGVPVLSLAPVGGASHRAGEWVSQASLERVHGLYTALIDGFDAAGL